MNTAVASLFHRNQRRHRHRQIYRNRFDFLLRRARCRSDAVYGNESETGSRWRQKPTSRSWTRHQHFRSLLMMTMMTLATTCRKLTSCRNGCEATPKLFASRRPGFSKAEIGGNPTPNSEHSRARALTPKALTRALSALSPSSVGSYHLCRGFPARSIRDRCVELRKPLRSQQKIAQFRWASLSLQPILARLRWVLAKIDSRYWV